MNPLVFPKQIETGGVLTDTSHTTKWEVSHPLDEIDVGTPEKVVGYFPQDLMSIQESAERAKAVATQGIKAITSIPKDERTFANTLYAMDELQAFFHSQMQALWVVSMTHTEKKIRDEAKSEKDGLKAFLIENFQCNKALYRAFNEAVEVIEKRGDTLTEQQTHYIQEKKQSFRREGLELEGDIFESVKAFKIQMCEVESTFLKNLDEDDSHIWVKEEALEGIPKRVLERLEEKEGSYKLTCDYPVYFPVMKYCQVEATRKAMYHAFTNRAADENIPHLRHLIAIRDHLAQKLGYRSFAEYDLEGQMAESPERVQAFIDSLAEAAKGKADVEIKTLTNELPESVLLTDDNKIKPWDFTYLRECYKAKHLSVDETKIQEYFPFEPTLQKLLDLYSQLFNLEFKEVSNEGLWHPTTKMVAVYTKGEKSQLVGHVILDLFPREGKFGHGYCVDVLAPSKTASGDRKPAIATVLANLTPACEDRPSLLMHGEATTLFHELGHCLHQLLGCAEMPTLSGYHVKIDFLELPSQLLEEMLWDPKILSRLGEHYQTKEPLPEEMIEKKIAARHFNEGYFVLRQMVLSSMSLHYFQEGLSKNTKVIREELVGKYLPFLAVYPGSNDEGTFRHLADPLYRSKYYCYSWAEWFAKDVYEHILELSEDEEAQPWLEYRKQILEPAGGINPNQLLFNFLGRLPSLEAYKRSLRC